MTDYIARYSIMIAFVTLLLLFGSNSAVANSAWSVQGSTATVSLAIGEAKVADAVATFFVAFNSSTRCEPEVGFILTRGKTLGAPERRQLATQQKAMKRSRFTEKQVTYALRQHEAGQGRAAVRAARRE